MKEFALMFLVFAAVAVGLAAFGIALWEHLIEGALP